MEYDNTKITCVICKEEIPCIFDEEAEVTVPQVASFSNKKKQGQEKALSKDIISTTKTSPEKVLIYLTCPNFHGPFPYQVKTK